jgi:hypothetical protein
MNVDKSDLYFASCTTVDGIDLGVIKIGLSHKPLKRMRELTVNEPFVCELICTTPGDIFLEYFCHMWLDSDRVAGEYFKKSPEMERMIASIQQTGKLPFPIEFTSEEGTFIHLDVTRFMRVKGISFRDVEDMTGLNAFYYKKMVEERKHGSRRFLAALAVTAVKKGHKILWARDFRPSKAPAASDQDRAPRTGDAA